MILGIDLDHGTVGSALNCGQGGVADCKYLVDIGSAAQQIFCVKDPAGVIAFQHFQFDFLKAHGNEPVRLDHPIVDGQDGAFDLNSGLRRGRVEQVELEQHGN